MKVKVIERSASAFQPDTLGGTAPKSRNLDPSLHPFARQREYQRATTASKLERMHAKPFIASLEGHTDGIYSTARDSKSLTCVASGGGDGQITLWDLPGRRSMCNIPQAHGRHMVNDLCFAGGSASSEAGPSGRKFTDEGDEVLEGEAQREEAFERSGRSARLLSCSVDKTIKLWDTTSATVTSPVQTFVGRTGFNSVSHHRSDPIFASASDRVHLWDETKTSPIMTLSYNTHPTQSSRSTDVHSGEHLTCVRFSQSETSLLAASSADRSITLFDARTGSATSRMTMAMRTNQLQFNPMEPTVLLLASEDHNLYTFDIRSFKAATQVYKSHVGAVMSCDWSPTGREFVSGSYDRTVRLWGVGVGKSKDAYHTKRMQRVFSIMYTLDSRFVLSGSDDGNLRLWKSRASDKLGILSTREIAKRQYRDTLRDKWGNVGDVAKLERQRYLPKSIYGAQKIKNEMLEARATKEDNRRAHAAKSVAGPSERKAERKKAVLRQEQ